jgi:nucleotide-binding universal stress UspA family protein
VSDLRVGSGQEQAMNSAQSPGPVVVAVDGSEAAIGAARWAAREAIHRDVSIRLVHVIQTADGPTRSDRTDAAEHDYAESSLRAACLAIEATDLPVKIDTAVLYGDLDCALIAESSSATLMCAGSVGIGRVANMVLGSTAAILAREAHCPVAIIRRGDQSPCPEDGLIAVVVDDGPGNREVVRCAMEEARMRRAPVLALCVGRRALFESGRDTFYRRLDGTAALSRRRGRVRDNAIERDAISAGAHRRGSVDRYRQRGCRPSASVGRSTWPADPSPRRLLCARCAGHRPTGRRRLAACAIIQAAGVGLPTDRRR